MTIKELKELLQGYLDDLDDFDDDCEVNLATNTYFLTRRGARSILETRKGFVDLENPVRYESEDDD